MDVRETITAVGTLRVPRVFDVVDAIYVPDGTTGIFALSLSCREPFLGSTFVDKVFT